MLGGKELPLAVVATCCLAVAMVLLTVDHDSAPVALEGNWVFVDEPRHDVPAFDWSNKDNVKVFYGRCVEGDEASCEELVNHQEALAVLTDMGNEGLELKPFHDEFGDSGGWDWEREENEEEDDGWAKDFSMWDDEFHAFNEGAEPEEGDEIGSTKSKEEAARALPQALRLLVGRGLANHRQLSRLVAVVEPRCSQEKGNCGPTQPAIDHGADIDLTEGWLNLEYECCPCLGRGVERIGYDQFDMAGSYNPYTMNLCTQCDGCS